MFSKDITYVIYGGAAVVRGRGGLWWGIRGRMQKKFLKKNENNDPVSLKDKFVRKSKIKK